VAEDKKFPTDAVAIWPEIFNEIEINVVPLNYVCTVRIIFKNNKIWEVNCSKKMRSKNLESFHEQMKETVSKYEDQIEKIDFQLDTSQIKKDIIKSTNKFLKNKKLK
jgi:hypothetical protein